MANVPLGHIRIDDSPSIDAFARLRVSQPVMLLDVKRVGSIPQNMTSTAVSGTGAVVYSAPRASFALTVGAGVGTAVRQSKTRAIYQPSKSLLVFQTFIMASGQTNLRQRVGYFDTNNGVFLEQVNGVMRLVRRSYVTGSPVDTAVAQSNWNMAQELNGRTIDFTKPQILVMDFEWLGVGRIRIGFVIDGIPIYVHQFLNANASLTSVYMSNPNLPLRWEIEATGAITGTATLESICGSVSSEGGYELTGASLAADTGTTANAIASGASEEIIAIRMQSAFTEFATAFIQQLSVINTTTGPFRWQLVLNPTETGAGTWSNVGNSIMEKNTTRTVTANTGVLLNSGYVSASANAVEAAARPILTMGTTLAGVTDVISLQIHNLSVSSEDFFGSLTWRESY